MIFRGERGGTPDVAALVAAGLDARSGGPAVERMVVRIDLHRREVGQHRGGMRAVAATDNSVSFRQDSETLLFPLHFYVEQREKHKANLNHPKIS